MRILGGAALEGLRRRFSAEIINGLASPLAALLFLVCACGRSGDLRPTLLSTSASGTVIDLDAVLISIAEDVLELDLRQDLVVKAKNSEIGLALRNLLGFLFVFGHLDLGLHGGLSRRARSMIGPGQESDRIFVDDYGNEGLAVHLAQMPDGDRWPGGKPFSFTLSLAYMRRVWSRACQITCPALVSR